MTSMLDPMKSHSRIRAIPVLGRVNAGNEGSKGRGIRYALRTFPCSASRDWQDQMMRACFHCQRETRDPWSLFRARQLSQCGTDAINERRRPNAALAAAQPEFTMTDNLNRTALPPDVAAEIEDIGIPARDAQRRANGLC
ncbi:hypothetical protein AB4Y44_30655 [Paraburkholderia sp. BR10937]|uniref:hypothetical protein n=1 Tax=Paraburkholderia sp. BR10937 TaxID=3236994 RepID=UPI0034D292AD